MTAPDGRLTTTYSGTFAALISTLPTYVKSESDAVAADLAPRNTANLVAPGTSPAAAVTLVRTDVRTIKLFLRFAGSTPIGNFIDVWSTLAFLGNIWANI